MRPTQLKRLEQELSAYLDALLPALGRPAQRSAQAYVTGLLLEGERKSIAPMAARLVDTPSQAEAMRQRLQECVVISPWLDDHVRRPLALLMEQRMPSLEAWVVDDTGIPKKGLHSVGVQRQYSGTLGRVDNCQVAVSLHLAGELGSACIQLRLYLPQSWATDAARRQKAGIPADIDFARKWEIAVWQIDQALSFGLRKRVVLADAGYGDAREFREALSRRGLSYVVAVSGIHCVWPPGVTPQVPKKEPGTPGRPPSRDRAAGQRPLAISALCAALPASAYRTLSWKQGSQGRKSSRFARLRVRSAERVTKNKHAGEEQWLLCEWPRGEAGPTRFYLSTLPERTSLKKLVRLAKLRWRIERDYQEMKQELGLDHFEGRTWRGFHHHATLCAVAHAFLALQRALFPPEPGAVDAANGEAASAADAAAENRLLSAVPAAH